jgi:equilibrative nucleoside transporter 1/2/3
MLSGQGFVGATISLVQLIAALSSSSSSSQTKGLTIMQEDGRAHRAAIEFFVTTTILMGCGMAVFIALQRSDVYVDMRRKMDSEKRGIVSIDEENAVENGVSGEEHLSSVTGIKRYMGIEMQRQASLVVSTQKKVFLPSISIAYIFIITLALFPALTARIQSTGKTISPIVFVALHFFIFNLGDLVGRSSPSIAPRLFLLRKVKMIALFCFLRTAFVPLLGYCNISSSSSTIIGKVLFGDVVFFLLIALLGISNGLLATSIFVTGPHQENLVLPHEQALAAGLLTWWLSIGLAIGSLLSFVVAPDV